MPKLKDSLGDRMKANYENRTRFYLPRRTYTIIRLDGKAFHTFTRSLEKPFDQKLIDDLEAATCSTLGEIQGAEFAYLQSDEISILLTDFKTITTESWFDGNIQKMCSVAASTFTAYFNLEREPISRKEAAVFDARVFTIPDQVEVMNYFIWRQKDCVRNSIQSVAQSLYSQKELNGKNCDEMQEMIFQKGINWADYDEGLKNGRVIFKDDSIRDFIVQPAPVFTKNIDYLKVLIAQSDRVD